MGWVNTLEPLKSTACSRPGIVRLHENKAILEKQILENLPSRTSHRHALKRKQNNNN